MDVFYLWSKRSSTVPGWTVFIGVDREDPAESAHGTWFWAGVGRINIKLKQIIRNVLTLKRTHEKKLNHLNGEWPVSQMAFDWFPYSCFSKPVHTQRQMLQAAHVCFPHTLGSKQTLPKAGWSCHCSLWSLPQELTFHFFFFFFQYSSNPNYFLKIKINSRLKTSSWMPFLLLLLLGKAQFSAVNYPW